ncbi:hypothetical protein DPMN_168337 [Dreissena polymorpha]|uniref:Uncharacterized protein n=1 Tax=Dreissena polymorpha TaxID=45954 RepID=A0A9D4F693_DREPO|nr:hypothetical protein DPMN_168337 [Dreissena polymorpha]
MPDPLGGHVVPPTGTIFELIKDIIGTNLLTKFHDDRTINVASRVLTRKNTPPSWWSYRKINVASRVLTRKNAPSPGGHVFQPTSIIFELLNLLTKFHEDRTINVASRVKNAPPLGIHVFQANTIHVASRVLTRKTALPPVGHGLSPIWTIFELVRDINKTNVLTKFHDDLAKIVTSRVFTRNTAPPPAAIFELSRGIYGTNVLTKFHEDQFLAASHAPQGHCRTFKDLHKSTLRYTAAERSTCRIEPDMIRVDPALVWNWSLRT